MTRKTPPSFVPTREMIGKPTANGGRAILIMADELDHGCYRLLNIENEDKVICTPGNAHHCLRTYDPRVIVVDAGSDVEEGLALVRRIKETHVSVPVIFVAEANYGDTAGKSLVAGARLFRAKPLSLIELADCIKTLLGFTRSSRENRTALPAVTCCAPEPTQVDVSSTTDKPLSILRGIAYIQQNLSSQITLEQLATEAHVSKYHFCRLFKRHTKMTPLEFISCMRVQKAKELLRRKDLSISMVALEVGCNDASSFIRIFKKFTGQTPTDYRKSLRRTPPIRPDSDPPRPFEGGPQ